jgi:hypothetical protein
MVIKNQRKAQMKIQQMAFMLIAVTLFFVLVGMFVLVFVFSGIRESAALIEEQNALLLVTGLADSPEFSCGNAFGTTKVSCVDESKILGLQERIGNYDNFWGVSGIEIRKIYPDNDVIRIFGTSSGTGVSNFVSLCNKENVDGRIYDKCELARLIVSYGGEDE